MLLFLPALVLVFTFFPILFHRPFPLQSRFARHYHDNYPSPLLFSIILAADNLRFLRVFSNCANYARLPVQSIVPTS